MGLGDLISISNNLPRVFFRYKRLNMQYVTLSEAHEAQEQELSKLQAELQRLRTESSRGELRRNCFCIWPPTVLTQVRRH